MRGSSTDRETTTLRSMYKAYGKGAAAGSWGNLAGAITGAVSAGLGTHPVASVVVGMAASAVATVGALAAQVPGLRRRHGDSLSTTPENKVRHSTYSAYLTGMRQHGLATWVGTLTAVSSVEFGAHPAWSAGAGIMTAAASASLGRGRYERDLRSSLTETVAAAAPRTQQQRAGRPDDRSNQADRTRPGPDQTR